MWFYFLRLKKLSNVKFKKRIVPYYSIEKFTFGNIGLFTIQQLRFEAVYFRFLKKTIRKKYRKKKILFSKQKYWIRFNKNNFLSKKAKNARMGSGKGNFLRPCFFLKPNKPFIEFRQFNRLFIISLRNRLKKKIPCNLKTIAKNYGSNFIN